MLRSPEKNATAVTSDESFRSVSTSVETSAIRQVSSGQSFPTCHQFVPAKKLKVSNVAKILPSEVPFFVDVLAR